MLIKLLRLFVLFILIAACDWQAHVYAWDEESRAIIEVYDVDIDRDGGQLTASYHDPSGWDQLVRRYNNAEALAQDLPQILAQAPSSAKTRLFFGNNISGEILSAIQGSGSTVCEGDTCTSRQPLVVGHYYISARYDGGGYVSGCISRNTPHVNAILRDTNVGGSAGLLFDLHVAMWRDSHGNTCLGMYESARRAINWCPPCTSVPRRMSESASAVRDGIRDGLMRMNIPLLTATTLATIMAGMIIVLAPAGV
ncbi:MAG: hypothetical protein WCV84_04810 [Patescibacteria group bacterium]